MQLGGDTSPQFVIGSFAGFAPHSGDYFLAVGQVKSDGVLS